MTVEFIFSEFNDRSRTHHFKFLTNYGEKYRLDPTYSSIKQYFPDAKITVYTDREHIKDVYPDVEVIMIDMDNCPFSGRSRCPNYCNDYYQADGYTPIKTIRTCRYCKHINAKKNGYQRTLKESY